MKIQDAVGATPMVEIARFAPPHGGGTLRVHVPFALRRVPPGEAP